MLESVMGISSVTWEVGTLGDSSELTPSVTQLPNRQVANGNCFIIQLSCLFMFTYFHHSKVELIFWNPENAMLGMSRASQSWSI